MKARTQGFKEQIKLQGREIEVKVSYGDVVLDSETINIFKPHFNTEFFKTIMKTFEFDSNIKVPAKTWVTPEFGVKVEGEYEYLNYGQYYINDEPEYSADNRAYTHKAYDSMIEAMIPFDENPLYIEYPISYDDLINAICNQLGWTYDLPADYPNKDTEVEYDLYSNLGLTYRDILDDLCPATMGNFIVSDDREFKLIYPTETGDTIDEEYLKDANVNVSKKVGPINSLVLSRAEEGDEIYRRDEESIDENNLNEIKIKDNLLLSSAFRENFIDEMFDRIKNFEYYSIDVASTGVAYYEPLDRFTMSIGNENYSVVLLNSELNVESGVSENLFTPELEEAVTDYSTSGLTDKGQKMANIIAYKNEARIEMLTSEINDLTNYIKITNRTGDYLALTDTPKSGGAINTLSIKGFDLRQLYPGMAYPSEYTYPGVLNFYTLIFDTINTFDNNPHYIYINSPIPLQKLGSVYDELIIESNKVKVIQRIGYDFINEQWSVLSSPITHELNDVLLPTFDGDTYISVRYFDNLVYNAEYLIKNDLTSNFATQLESSSQFKLNQNEIEAKVNRDGIISSINLSPEEIKILAEKIKIEGLTTINENFKVLLDGSIEAVNAKLTGDIFLPNGGRVIGGDGILTVAQFVSNGMFENYGLLGFNQYYGGIGESYSYTDISIEVHIPKDFTIISSIIDLYHTPVLWNNYSGDVWGYSRNLKLYYVTNQDQNYEFHIAGGSEYEIILPNLSLAEIQTLGTPTNTTGSSIYKITSNDFKSILKAGKNKIVVRTTDALPSTVPVMNAKTGVARGVVTVIGYMSQNQ